jgi:hypothetical protein
LDNGARVGIPWNAEKAKESLGGFALPPTEHGVVYSFSLPGEDEVSHLREVGDLK